MPTPPGFTAGDIAPLLEFFRLERIHVEDAGTTHARAFIPGSPRFDPRRHGGRALRLAFVNDLLAAGLAEVDRRDPERDWITWVRLCRRQSPLPQPPIPRPPSPREAPTGAPAETEEVGPRPAPWVRFAFREAWWRDERA